MSEHSTENDAPASVLDVIAEALCPPSHREGWVRHIVGKPTEFGPRRVCVLHSAQARNVLDALHAARVLPSGGDSQW